MDCVRPIFARLWDWIANRAHYVFDLQKNLDCLKDVKSDLENKSKDVEVEADLKGQQPNVAITNEAKGWLEKVQRKLKDVDDIWQKGDEEIQKKCMGSCFPMHCYTCYKLGKQVVEEIAAVEDLIAKAGTIVVVQEVSQPLMVEIPMESVVGMDSEIDEVWKCVEDRGVRIIGLFGMGGVGKTTLLKKLNNEFLKTRHNFEVVIWVLVSENVKLGEIQNTIRRALGFSDHSWSVINEEDRPVRIWSRLRTKRFVLLLDDLWGRLDLPRVGVQLSENQNEFKIVFTTRSDEVCGQMEANRRFKLTGLPQDTALSLFRQKVGEDVLNSHHEIPKLAEIVAAECKGMPLALITIGRAMASRRRPDEWKFAIKVLKGYPSEFPGMEKDVFPALRFSYDSLSDDSLGGDTLKKCFLYCSIFPEDHNIENKELVDLWIGEGFFNEFDDAQEKGRYVIESLKRACLLEESYHELRSHENDHVKIHDVLRDMAHWLAREDGNEILVCEDSSSIGSRRNARWKKVVRASFNGDGAQALMKRQDICARLRTMFVMRSKLTAFPGTLFESMQYLQVLNLSKNRRLTKLPIEIGLLKSLHYLNLSKTCLNELPIEVRNLIQLRVLLLDEMGRDDEMWYDDEMGHDVVIPPGVISSLLSLEIYSRFEFDNEWKVDTELIEELGRLENITDIRLSFSSVNSIREFMNAPNLQSCITRLSINNCEELSLLDISSADMRRMEHLEALYIYVCPLREVRIERSRVDRFRKLQIIHIWQCAMRNLTWLIYTPELRFLHVINCESLEEIITCDFGGAEIEEVGDIFSNLKEIYFRGLEALKSICRGAMPFSSLEEVKIEYCPSLRKLPFNAESAPRLEAIGGQQGWWDELEWEDDATKLAFTPKFDELRYRGVVGDS